MVAKTRAFAFAFALAVVAVVSVIEGARAQASPVYETVAPDGNFRRARTAGRYAYFRIFSEREERRGRDGGRVGWRCGSVCVASVRERGGLCEIPSEPASRLSERAGADATRCYVCSADLDESLDVGSTKYFSHRRARMVGARIDV